MTTEPQSPLSESEKLAATLAALEAERQRRVEAGKLGARPILQVLPQTGETLEAAQQREVYRYLADHPDGAKCIAGYDWVEFVLVERKGAGLNDSWTTNGEIRKIIRCAILQGAAAR